MGRKKIQPGKPSKKAQMMKHGAGTAAGLVVGFLIGIPLPGSAFIYALVFCAAGNAAAAWSYMKYKDICPVTGDDLDKKN